MINQALDRDPQRRFQQVNELAEAFSQAARGAWGPEAVVLPPSSVERVQESPRDGYPGANWQLLPPVVTGKIPTLKVPPVRSAGLEAPTLVNTDSWQTRTQGATMRATGPVPAPPTLVNTDSWQTAGKATAGRVPSVQPAARKATPAVPVVSQSVQREQQQAALLSPDLRSLPGAQGDAGDLAQAYAWWSQPGLASAPPQVKQNRLSVEPPVPASGEPLHLPPPPVADWTTDTPMLNAVRMQSALQPPRKLKRRYIVASLVTGATAVAVAGTVFALHLKQAGTSPSGSVPAVAQNPPSVAPQSVKPTAQAQPTPSAQAKPAMDGHMGTVVGSPMQAKNSSVFFTNPADNNQSLLIHLPNGSFVAYERACTHEGVPVNYDPATSTIICPAHGSIFDPAHGGKVLKGPALTPIASVTVHVNGDGTITAV